MGYKPNLVTITPSRTRTVPSKSVSKTGAKRTTKSPTIPTDTFNYSSLENRGIAVYNPVTGESQYAISSAKKPVVTSSSNVIPFYPGRKIDTIPQSSNTNTSYSKSTPNKPSSNNTPGVSTALTLMGITGATYGAVKYLEKKNPGSTIKVSAPNKVVPSTSTTSTTLKNNNSTFIKTKVKPKIETKVDLYNQALADMKGKVPYTPTSKYTPPIKVESTSNVGEIIAKVLQKEQPVVVQNKPYNVGETIARTTTQANYEKLFDQAIDKENKTIEQRKLQEASYKAAKTANKEFGKNMAREIATGKPAPIKPIVAETITPPIVKKVVPQTRVKVIPTSASKGAEKVALNRLPNQLPQGKRSLSEFQDIMKNTFNENKKESLTLKLKGVRSGIGKGTRTGMGIFTGALPLLDIAKQEKEYYNNVKTLGKQEADRIRNEQTKQIKQYHRLNNTTQQRMDPSNFQLGYGGKVPNKGFGDILGNVAVGAGTGALTGSVVPGWGTAVGAVVGGLSGLMKGISGNKQDKLQEEAIAKQKELQLAQQKELDQQYMANYKPIQMNSLYAMGGNIGGNPIPNKYIINKSKVRKYVGGEPTANFVDRADTLLMQDTGYWGENLQGVNIPKELPVDANGKVVFPKGNKMPTTLVNKANGGAINNVAIPDKNAIPINSKAEVVVNNQGTTAGSHETGQNIPVTNEQGQQTANVEPGEVVMTTSKGQQYALSSRLGFAEKYQMMNDMIDKANARLRTEKDLIKRTTITRNIDKVKRAMDMLPQQQEVTKQKMGISDTPQKAWAGINLGSLNLNQLTAQKNATDEAANLANMAYPSDFNITGLQPTPRLGLASRTMPSIGGAPAPTSLGETGFLNSKLGGAGSIGTIAQLAVPFITNAMNNRTLNKSMEKINNLQNTPIAYRNLDDKVDVSAQIGQVNNSYRDAVRGTRGLSDSRTAAAMKGEFAANRIGAINPILENASNTSRGIRNQNVSNINTLNTVNAQRNDELSKYKLENQVGLNNAKIAGRNQAVDNIYSILREKNMAKQDQVSLGLLLKTYNQDGVMTRQLSDLLKVYGIDPSIVNVKK